VGDELKRLFIITVMVLAVALGLLLPLVKWGVPRRPASVPSTANLANGGKNSVYWIDCGISPGVGRFYCTVYMPHDGEMVLRGSFQQTLITGSQRISYDGSVIQWKHGALLRPLRLDCILGGRPPEVADCKSGESN
jgi:hypothetical protein